MPESVSDPSVSAVPPATSSAHSDDDLKALQVMTLSAGLILALTFFLPLFRSGETPFELVGVMLTQVSNPSVTLAEHFAGFCANVASYLFGGLLASAAAARLLGWPRLAHVFSFATALLLTCTALGMFWSVGLNPLPIIPDWLASGATFVAATGTLAYVLFATRLGRGAFLCYAFAGELALLVWFGFSSLLEESSPFVLLSLVSAVVLLASTLTEARLALRRSLLETEWLLLTCLAARRRPALQPQHI